MMQSLAIPYQNREGSFTLARSEDPLLSGPKLAWVIRLSPIPAVLTCEEIAERVVGSGGKLKWCQDLCTDYGLPYEKGLACQIESLS